MLHQLSSSDDNGQSMVIPSAMKHAPSVFIILWQWSEHGDFPSGMKRVPSVVIFSWQRSEYVKTRKVERMLHQLSSSHDNGQSMVIRLRYELRQLLSFHDNGQSMVIPPSNMKHSPSNIIVSWQRSEQNDTPLPGWHMLCHLSSSSDNGQSMVIRFRYEICSVSCHHLRTGVRA